MVWVYIALAIIASFILCLHFLKFHFSLDVRTPDTLQGAVGVSFLWWRRETVLDAAQALSARIKEEAERKEGESGKSSSPTSEAESNPSGPPDNSPPDQRGAVRIPDSWIASAVRFRIRLKSAFLKMGLDWGVWRALIHFLLKSGRRVLGLLHPRLKHLRIGMEDVYDLGRFAAGWSVVTGTFPALTCPVEYGFAERSFSLKARIAGGFSGLGVIGFGLLTLFTFPWGVLVRRFIHCWRNPELNRWQRRVLLP